MGEDITVESDYGEGTTFTFTLKRAEAPITGIDALTVIR